MNKRLIHSVFLALVFDATAQTCPVDDNTLEELKLELEQLENRRDEVDEVINDYRKSAADLCPAPEPGENVRDWVAAIEPYIPTVPREFRIIPNTDITPVLEPDDGSLACRYLRCNSSKIALIDWVGMDVDLERGIAWFLGMGGHADLGTNTVYTFDIGSLRWSRDYDYSPPAAPFPNLVDSDGNGVDECTLPVEGPFGAHTYDGVLYVPSRRFTLLLTTSGYSPNWDCEVIYDPYPTMWAWHDDGYWIDLGVENTAFPRATYDQARDKILYVAHRPESALYEMDPHTLESVKLADVWSGKGGVLVLDDNRNIWFSSLNGGLYTTSINLQGKIGEVRQVLDSDQWSDKGAGIGVSGDLVVGWTGSNEVYHYNLQTKSFEVFRAGGDQLPQTSGTGRVFGKFMSVPGLPGIFLGIADNYGWVVYRAF